MSRVPPSQNRPNEGENRKPDTLRPRGQFSAPPQAPPEQGVPRSRLRRRELSKTDSYEQGVVEASPSPSSVPSGSVGADREPHANLIDEVSRTSGVLGCAEVLLDRKLLDGELVDTEMVTSYRSSRDGLDIVDAALACADALRVQSSVLSRAGAPGEPRELLISQNGHAMLVVPHPCDADRLVVSAVEGRDSDINLALHKLRSLLTSRS